MIGYFWGDGTEKKALRVNADLKPNPTGSTAGVVRNSPKIHRAGICRGRPLIREAVGPTQARVVVGPTRATVAQEPDRVLQCAAVCVVIYPHLLTDIGVLFVRCKCVFIVVVLGFHRRGK